MNSKELLFLTALCLAINFSIAFDTSLYDCTSQVVEENAVLLETDCSIYNRSQLKDYSNVVFLGSQNATNVNDCCTQCKQVSCDFFLSLQKMDQTECNFYLMGTSSQINICLNNYLTVGIPAVEKK